MQANTSLTAKQERLIAALLANASVVDAAKACKINESTAYRWLKLSHFQDAYKAARRAAFDELLLALMTGTGTALKVLHEAMKQGETHSVRVRAAQIWLEQAIAVHKMSELEAEIAELRALLKARIT